MFINHFLSINCKKCYHLKVAFDLFLFFRWNRLRQISNSEKNIGVALEIGPDLPDNDVLVRWLGEPVRCALIPTNIFLTNKRGYPVLSRPHQSFVKQLTNHDCKIFITGACRHENIVNYRKYIEHIARVSIYIFF